MKAYLVTDGDYKCVVLVKTEKQAEKEYARYLYHLQYGDGISKENALIQAGGCEYEKIEVVDN